MTIRAAVSNGWREAAALIILLAIAAPMVMAQDRSRGATRGAKARTEQAERTTSEQRTRTERAAKSSRSSSSSRSREAKQRATGREREPKARAGKARARGQQGGRSSSTRRTVAPRKETQRQRRTPVRRQSAVQYRPPKGVKPPKRRKARHRRGNVSINIDITWPWPHRSRRTWRPRYRYRQVVHVRTAWGSRRRSARIDVRTRYHHRVRRADAHRAEVDVYLDAIELYADGRYLGTVDRIPGSLRRVRATLYRDGRAHFDRELFVVGHPGVGFELIATRAYDGYVLGAYRRGDWVKAGAIDLYAGEVVPVRRSRLFRPHDFNGLVPISLLPDDLAWRCDVGFDAVSARPYHAPEPYKQDATYYYGFSTDGHSEVRTYEHEPLRRTRDDTFRLEAGAQIDITREVQLERIR